MSDMFTVGSRMGSTTPCMEFFDKGTGRTVDFKDALGAPQSEFAVTFTATLAQINAGLIVVAPDPNRTLAVVGIRLAVNGNFATFTDIRISDTAAVPVDIMTVAQAQLTTGAIIGSAAATGVTFGAFGGALTAGKGIQIRQTGTAGTAGTSIAGVVHFILT